MVVVASHRSFRPYGHEDPEPVSVIVERWSKVQEREEDLRLWQEQSAS